MDKWKTIMTFSLPHEVYFLEGLLKSEGIPTYLKDEFTVQVDNFLSNAIGGVKLMVPESEFEKANDILRQRGNLKIEEE